MPRRRKDDTSWRARVGAGGWVEVEPGGGERVLVRVHPDEAGRYRVRELHLFESGKPLSAERLRAVRVAPIEDLLNLPEERAAIAARIDEPGIDLEAALRDFAAPPRPGSQVVRLGKAHEKSSATRLRVTVAGKVAQARIERPGQRGYPDEFYEGIVAVYREAARSSGGSGRQVMAIANAADVPRSTAARWVKEARRRKLLGPAPARGKGGERPQAGV